MSAPLAVLRFPRTLAQRKGRYAVTTPDGAVVMACDVTDRGRQVDVTAPGGEPWGRIVENPRQRWQLLAPGLQMPVAAADVSRGVRVRVGTGPDATIVGRGEEWDLVWEATTLLAARKTPRKVAKASLDVWVQDPSCTPAIVAFVVHVRRWAQSAESATS